MPIPILPFAAAKNTLAEVFTILNTALTLVFVPENVELPENVRLPESVLLSVFWMNAAAAVPPR